MRVSLHRIEPCRRQASSSSPLLDPRGARVVLGGAVIQPAAPVTPIVPTARTLFAPRGACLVSGGGPLVVCDTGHHRLLLWQHPPAKDDTPADLVIGQADFISEGRNGKAAIGPATLNVPTGVASDPQGVVAVADSWNHRVLLWHSLPQTSNQPADVVLGQANFASGDPNLGGLQPTAASLNWCCGVAIHERQLFVADTGNRRVLVWDHIPTANGEPADLVLGQPEFTMRAVGGGAIGMRWPHALAVAAGMLFVADAGSSRIMVWNGLPRRNRTPCDLVLGQADLTGAEHNRSGYDPTAATLNMPYGLTPQADRLVVSDTANSRLLGFELAGLAMGAPGRWLAGQRDFGKRGDNRWGVATRDSLCWPYAVAACGPTLVVADSGNNRVLLWDAAGGEGSN
jgi:hypothetical protein